MRKKFRVRIGRHVEPIGERDKKIYEKGDVVTSDKDLAKMFPQKFDDLGPAGDEEELVTADASESTPRKGKPKKGEDDWND